MSKMKAIMIKRTLLLMTLAISWICASCSSGQRFPPAQANAELDFPLPEAVNFDPSTQIKLTPIVEELDRPVFVTHAGDGSGRLFVIEKEGRIRIVAEGALRETPLLDISERVNDGGNEQGLLGLAFPPDFSERKFLFVNYTNEDGDTTISRFHLTDDPNVADPASETTILQIDQPARNHNGGMITFGPDGMLWIGMGDGGGSGDRYGNGQNPETLLGKILRIDVTSDPSKPYLIPADNPWVSSADTVSDEIWATGLRNPWRFSFDRGSGDLWIGDVGQGKYEEVNRVPQGRGGFNFGWSILEGTHCYQETDCEAAGLVQPVTEYEHGTDGCSVTGGYVYRGQAIPGLKGVYLYGDYCSGRIWALWHPPSGEWQNVELLDSDLSISSFGEDEVGEVYVTGYSGSVYRIDKG